MHSDAILWLDALPSDADALQKYGARGDGGGGDDGGDGGDGGGDGDVGGLRLMCPPEPVPQPML